MLRQGFEQKQQHLRDDVLVLGSYVELALMDSVQVIEQRDHQRAQHLIKNNRNINRKCGSIQSNILSLLATQQPMAGDLRYLAAMLQIALELERVSDHAKEIAQVNLKLREKTLICPLDDIKYMAKLAGKMLNRALEAFARQNVDLARAVPYQDDEIDGLYLRIHQQVLTATQADPDIIAQVIYLSHVGHHLERVGDRATNICEWVVFVVTGQMKELNVNQLPVPNYLAL